MKKKIFLLFPLLALIGLLAFAACTPTSSSSGDEKESVKLSGEYDVVLFTGQSNMVGRENVRYEADIPEGTAFEYLNGSDEFVPVKNPVGEAMKNAAEKSGGSSIVPAFCEKWVKETGRKIVAVHVARGGMDISHFNAPDGRVYKDISKKFRNCLDKLEEQNVEIGKKFYVFYQGESDTTNGSSAEQYKERYMNFHNSMKDEFGFDFGANIYVGKDVQLNEAGIRLINGAKKEIAEANDDVIVCEKSPALFYRDGREYLCLTRNDDTHLNAEGLRMVGENSAVNIINYLGLGADPAKKGVDPVDYLPEPEYDREWSGEYDVVLFTGQSNMVGQDTTRYAVDVAEGAALEYNYGNDILLPLRNPVGEGIGMSCEASRGSSIIPAFCEKWVKETGRKIIAVHVARGGQDISHFSAPDGDIYQFILKKYRACLDKLEEKNISVGKKFYVFYQGESDTTNHSTAEQYKEGFMRFHNAVKEELGLEFGATVYIGKNTQLNEAGIRLINDAKKELAEANDDVIVCEKSPALLYRDGREYLRVEEKDDTHLNAEGLRMVGENSAVNIIDYLGLGADSAKKGVDPVDYLPEPEYDKQD